MLESILKLPVRVARKIFRTIVPKDSAGVSYTPASTGLKRPPEAVKAAPKPKPAPPADEGHGHDHSHGHSHSHDHAPAAPQVDVWAEATPNPNAMKFTVGQKVVQKGSLSFNSKEEAEGNDLGEALFKVVGVRSVFAVNDFVTVTKEDSADWTYLQPAIINAIQSAF